VSRIYDAGHGIGRYEIKKFIGEGGMQEVYQAYDSALQRFVALKVPKNASAQRRFRRSVILSAKVNHPNAAKTFDYLEVGGRPHLVEEFIDGLDLSRILESLTILDPNLVAHILHHLARGVAASHHVQVVHRDLKPSNIMSAGDFSFSFLKITDFGIAKMAEEELADAAEGGDESISTSQTMMGALPYMSPEMIRTPRQTGTPSDIWAIAAIAFTLLTGERPFGRGLPAVANIISGVTPELPGFAKKGQFSELAVQIHEILKSCWRVDPLERPMADDLVARCSTLCYGTSKRATGTVENMPHGSWGFIGSSLGQVFFHQDSVYGESVRPGDRVCFAYFPGEPAPRAHPVVKVSPP
jgi:eukaryotic-like serine/threonine-protein kinase